jgi:hypothetical protein
MTSVLKKCVMGIGVAATLVATASPADAQYRRHYRGYRHDNTGVAIGAGILGLGIGAAIASSNRGYYGNGYYSGYSDPYYGGYSSYSDPYYGGYSSYDPYYGNGYGYTYRCTTHRQWDPYWRRWVRVRTC